MAPRFLLCNFGLQKILQNRPNDLVLIWERTKASETTHFIVSNEQTRSGGVAVGSTIE
jgi:hypothetical protein